MDDTNMSQLDSAWRKTGGPYVVMGEDANGRKRRMRAPWSTAREQARRVAQVERLAQRAAGER